jgi:hypothetical protein
VDYEAPPNISPIIEHQLRSSGGALAARSADEEPVNTFSRAFWNAAVPGDGACLVEDSRPPYTCEMRLDNQPSWALQHSRATVAAS